LRLALIVNCWSDWSMLRATLKILRPLVDGVIIIGSTKSSYGEHSPIPDDFHTHELHVHEPRYHIPLHSETDKRNYGLSIAKQQGYTHFLSCDADEVYHPEEFLKAKEHILRKDLNGIVCPSVVYFGSPTLTIGRDITLVPHIHKLTPKIEHAFNKLYPYAWSGRQIRIDPSRSLNINSGVEYTEEITLHHFSWCRGDYEKKIRNSTARANLERSTILEDLVNAKEGYRVQFYDKTLSTAPDYFGLNELLDKNLFPTQSSQPLATANQENKPS
jgi:glycosyltransferase involved in cell wall biosynthesis